MINTMIDWFSLHGLDLVTTILGLLYIALEYRAHIALWLVGIVMPALDVILYWKYGLYGDAGMSAYYTLAAVYGWLVWRFGKNRKTQKEIAISHMPLKRYVPVLMCFFAAWGATYWVLVEYTNSTVPVLDAFTNALGFVGLWALARKYVEQWVFWIIVDVIASYLYILKGIPFKAGLYALYVIIAIAGWRKWLKLMKEEKVQ
jgi:nicotinamide mononucleotide transporter